MIRVAIVEDDKRNQEDLRSVLERYSAEEHTPLEVDAFSDGVSFLDGFKSNYDVVFMDVEMPHLNGMDTAKKLRQVDEMCTLVFVTNMAQYAIGGYAVAAMDYILKPVAYDNVKFRLKRVFSRLRSSEKEVMIRVNGAVRRISVSDIYYVESYAHRVIYHTSGGDHEAWDSISHVEEELADSGFARCNSGYLVNLRYVTAVEGQVAVVGGYRLKISDSRKKPFSHALMDHINGVNSPNRED